MYISTVLLFATNSQGANDISAPRCNLDGHETKIGGANGSPYLYVYSTPGSDVLGVYDGYGGHVDDIRDIVPPLEIMHRLLHPHEDRADGFGST